VPAELRAAPAAVRELGARSGGIGYPRLRGPSKYFHAGRWQPPMLRLDLTRRLHARPCRNTARAPQAEGQSHGRPLRHARHAVAQRRLTHTLKSHGLAANSAPNSARRVPRPQLSSDESEGAGNGRRCIGRWWNFAVRFRAAAASRGNCWRNSSWAESRGGSHEPARQTTSIPGSRERQRSNAAHRPEHT